MDSWDKKYNVIEYIFGKKPNDFLRKLFRADAVLRDIDTRSVKALVLGSGEGRNAIFLAGLGAKVVGLERSQKAIDKSKLLELEKKVSISYVNGDVLKEKISPNSFDMVVSIWLHLAPGARQELYHKIDEVLKPGGTFILESFRKEQSQYEGVSITSRIMPNLAELQTYFKDYNIILAEEVDRHLTEGSEHQGMAAVLQFVCRKNLS